MACNETNICCSATCPATICANGRRSDGVTTFRKPCAQSNGLTWDRQGRLLVCEHATSRVTRTESRRDDHVIASHHEGKELNSPNDVVVDRTAASTSPILPTAASSTTAIRGRSSSIFAACIAPIREVAV